MPDDSAAGGLHLVRYDSMVKAIAECHKVDEVKQIRDKAKALEEYARQARNLDAERKAAEVRLRAERRAGELLKEYDANGKRDKPGGDRRSSSQPARMKLADLGISETQSSRWQALAEVPAKQFEDAMRDPVKKPTTTGLIDRKRERSHLNDEALWLWGRLREFEERGYFDADPQFLFDEMTEGMQSDFCRIVPLMQAFFTTCERICK